MIIGSITLLGTLGFGFMLNLVGITISWARRQAVRAEMAPRGTSSVETV
jgi:hypothetical protein